MPATEVTHSLNIVCALACEAKPIIDLLRLGKLDRTPFARFCGQMDGRQINLVVSGVGATNMTAAVKWLAGLDAGRNRAWLNLGIAGHKDLAVGELVLVHAVNEAGSNRRHYPPLIVKHAGISRPLISYSEPCMDYPDLALVDMEGAAFFTSAQKFANAELVQSLKVISDNQASGIEKLPAQTISDLIYPHAENITQFAVALSDLMPTPYVAPRADAWLAHLHFSVSHRHQLEQLLAKLEVLGALNAELQRKLKASSSARQALSILRDQLATLTPQLS